MNQTSLPAHFRGCKPVPRQAQSVDRHLRRLHYWEKAYPTTGSKREQVLFLLQHGTFTNQDLVSENVSLRTIQRARKAYNEGNELRGFGGQRKLTDEEEEYLVEWVEFRLLRRDAVSIAEFLDEVPTAQISSPVLRQPG